MWTNLGGYSEEPSRDLLAVSSAVSEGQGRPASYQVAFSYSYAAIYSSTALEQAAIDSSTALLRPHGCGDGAVARDGAVGQEAYQAYPAGSESGDGMNHLAEGDTGS